MSGSPLRPDARVPTPRGLAPADRVAASARTPALTRRFGTQIAVDEVDLPVPQGSGLRLPRAQRLGQDDDDPDAARA